VPAGLEFNEQSAPVSISRFFYSSHQFGADSSQNQEREKEPPSLFAKRIVMNNAGSSRRPSRLWYLILLIPFVATLWPPFYVHTEPELWGFPFFYWYQLAWIPASAICTGIVYFATT
jgi:hypothetical protein